MTDIEKELERFIASGKATTKVNSGRFQTTHIDPLKIAKHFAIWQEQKDILSWDSQTATFAPNIKPSEDERKAAISYAYDLDAYKEGSGVNINDVVMGFYGGLKWQKTQDQQTIELAEEHAMLAGMMQERERMIKDAIEGRLCSTVTGSEQYVSAYVGYGEYGKDGDKVKVIIIKE